jgi:hypothetical protein
MSRISKEIWSRSVEKLTGLLAEELDGKVMPYHTAHLILLGSYSQLELSKKISQVAYV